MLGIFAVPMEVHVLTGPVTCSVVGDEHSGVSSVEMLAIVDLSPSDNSCMYSTLLSVIEQARSLGQVTTCTTFDQPLYIEAVDIL